MTGSEREAYSAAIIAFCALAWLAVYIYTGKKGNKVSYQTFSVVRGVIGVLCALVAVAVVALGDVNEPDLLLDQPTAERTPALLFPLLTAQTTEDELCAAAEERELYAIASSQTEGLYYVVVDSWSLSNRNSAGVILEASFDRETGAFSAAKLTIRTPNGTARCRANVDAGGAMAYKTTVKVPWYAPGKTHPAENAQAALAIAYAAVYPDGM